MFSSDVAAKEILALTGGAGVDRIVDVDFGGNLGVSVDVIKVNGVIASYASMGEREPKLPFYALMAKNVNIRPVLIYTMPERAQDEAAGDVLRLVEAGRLMHVIGARFPLERIVEAHESGKVTGNLVVEAGQRSLPSELPALYPNGDTGKGRGGETFQADNVTS